MIEKLIDEYLAEKNAYPRTSSHKWYPSQFGKCFRAQYLKRKGEVETNPIDSRTLRIFAVGDLFHDFVQNRLPKHEKEVLIETEDTKGYADIVFEDAVWDIKSQHSKAFWWSKKKDYDVKKEKLPNWLQVTWYATQLKKPKVGLAYISKDDLCINEYVFDTKEFMEPLTAELNKLKEIWTNQEIPPAEPRCYGGKECSWCSYKDYCKKGESNAV